MPLSQQDALEGVEYKFSDRNMFVSMPLSQQDALEVRIEKKWNKK